MRANNKEAVERLIQIRIKNLDKNPQQILDLIDENFVKKFSTWGTLNNVPADVVFRAIGLLPMVDKIIPRSNIRKFGSFTKGHTDSTAFLRVESILKKYILDISIVYGMNPSSAKLAFRDILGLDFDDFIVSGKAFSKSEGQLPMEFLAVVGLIPKLQKYENNIRLLAGLANGALSFFHAQGQQKEFALELVSLLRGKLGEPPAEFPILLDTNLSFERDDQSNLFKKTVGWAQEGVSKLRNNIPLIKAGAGGAQQRIKDKKEKEVRKLEKKYQKLHEKAVATEEKLKKYLSLKIL